MRKVKREISNFADILDLLRNLDTLRLGISDQPYPYVVPVSFGFEVRDGLLRFYFHGAKEGKKAELLAENPRVCAEADRCYRFKNTDRAVTCLYESVIAFGTCRILTGYEARHGLEQILKHCGYSDLEIDPAVLPATAIWEITVESVTGKCRDKHN